MTISSDFPWILTTATVLFGLIALADRLLLQKRRASGAPLPLISDWAISFFPVLLLVLFIRSFVMQLYWVPTGSLEPTIDIGEMTFVTQYDYGLHAPVWHNTLLNTHTPKRGDIAVFRWPVNEKVNLIKRVVGVPGDVISFNNNVLTINGTVASQTFVKKATDSNSAGDTWPTSAYKEDLLGVEHEIYICKDTRHCAPTVGFKNLKVPAHHYFLMGDNRNNSDDSRDWGFVPEENLVGKGRFILFSWNTDTHHIRWNRFFTRLN